MPKRSQFALPNGRGADAFEKTKPNLGLQHLPTPLTVYTATINPIRQSRLREAGVHQRPMGSRMQWQA